MFFLERAGLTASLKAFLIAGVMAKSAASIAQANWSSSTTSSTVSAGRSACEGRAVLVKSGRERWPAAQFAGSSSALRAGGGLLQS